MSITPDLWRILRAHGVPCLKGRGAVVAIQRGVAIPVVCPDGQADEIGSVADLAACITSRRVEINATSEMVDEAAGLTARHVQKVEDTGRQFAESQKTTKADMAALMLRFSETGLTEEIAHTIRAVAFGAIHDAETAKDKPRTARVPTLDTALLAIQALGGRLIVEWGEIPRIMRSMAIAPREQSGKR